MLKTILITFSATASTLALAAHLFLNSILGTFGLAATSVDTLRGLQASQQVVQKMKTRQLQKKSRITKRFVKRSGKRPWLATEIELFGSSSKPRSCMHCQIQLLKSTV